MNYIQCILVKQLDAYSDIKQISWIPEKYAKKGKYLKLKGEDGWKVISTGISITEEQLKKRERDYLHQREASDI